MSTEKNDDIYFMPQRAEELGRARRKKTEEPPPNYHILSFPVISSISINYLATNSMSLGIPHN